MCLLKYCIDKTLMVEKFFQISDFQLLCVNILIDSLKSIYINGCNNGLLAIYMCYSSSSNPQTFHNKFATLQYKVTIAM